MIENILKSALSLFVIMGPFASIPVFLSVTKGMNSGQRKSAALQAIGTATVVLFIFLFLGPLILQAFMIDIPSLKIAGGVVLTILGMELVLSISFRKKYKYSAAITLLGSPLLTGPGVIVTTMIFVQDYGHLVTAIAAAIALASSLAVMLVSNRISKALGEYGTYTLSRITGLLLVAVAVGFIIGGAKIAVA
jgi:multiple antibiotic resistance protein